MLQFLDASINEMFKIAQSLPVMLDKAKVAVNNILNKSGKPIRVCRESIRKELEMTRGMNNTKLVMTNEYIKNIAETYEEYWKRKIKWGIEEIIRHEEHVSIFNIQLKCGFGGRYRPEIQELIKDVLSDIESSNIKF